MKNTNESGRSMVEMLGVLAIIGVLSVGGISAYTMAMTRFRANELVDAANKIGVLAFTKLQTSLLSGNTFVAGTTFALTGTGGLGYNSPIIGNPGVEVSALTTTQIQIKMTKLDNDVCQAAAALSDAKLEIGTATEKADAYVCATSADDNAAQLTIVIGND